ncbi:MAG: HD domain-containing protein [Candidatus Promineofilum sp.]|nr:HD domain-containing protein [Promineifilum sp.]
MGLRYRLRQLWSNLTAGPLSDAARREVDAALSPAERVLFDDFSAADQWHSYRVLCDLRRAGYNNADLWAAALLHDVGKTRFPLSAWDRTLIVVGAALFPNRVGRWGQGAAESRRRPFVVRAQHPEWGAEMAAAVGSGPVVVELIRRHQDKPPAEDELADLLRALQWADDQN